jgi:prevent-host-death family protein
MEQIGIRELRQNASQYITQVKAGQRITVTERGKPVAYLVPVDAANSVIDRLEAVGLYRPPTGDIRDLFPTPEAPEGQEPLSEVLLRMREDERF